MGGEGGVNGVVLGRGNDVEMWRCLTWRSLEISARVCLFAFSLLACFVFVCAVFILRVTVAKDLVSSPPSITHVCFLARETVSSVASPSRQAPFPSIFTTLRRTSSPVVLSLSYPQSIPTYLPSFLPNSFPWTWSHKHPTTTTTATTTTQSL